MQQKLKATPLVTQIPIGEGKDFCGVVDLVPMELLLWKPHSDGSDFSRVSLVEGGDFSTIQGRRELPVSEELLDGAMEARLHLVDQVPE